jgi:PAS domain S-box-containing protein
VGYIAAIVLPWVGINLSIKIHQLQGTPLALSFASIAGITIFTGLWPGVLASVANALIFNYCATAPVQGWSYSARDVIHTGIIVLIGLLVNFFCQRQRTIGDRLRAALASLQARTDSLMEAQQGSNAATWMFNVEDQRTDWTEGGTQVFGRPFSHVADFDSIVCSIVPEDRIHFEDVTGFSLRTGQPLRIEFRVKWPNGDIHWLESRGTPSATNANIWRGVTIDITDRKNAENALVRSEKLAAIGRLSATIAHEINNPLEAVTNLLYLASSDATLAPDTKLYLQGADRELARLANIVRRTLAFVRSKSSAGPADLAEVAESVVAMFRPRCVSHSAEIRLDKAADLKVAAPSDDLWQILTNLVSNACDALANSGGIIEISSIRHERSAVIYVRDNGAGIAAEDIGHIFDPFFTTKPDIGTGIGLSVTRDLVEKNGGRISVHIGNLPPGFRTSFRVELPLE